MRLLKDNFKLIFIVASMVIISIGTLIYDLNRPSLSADVPDEKLETFINNLKGEIGSLKQYDVSFSNNMLSLYYCTTDCTTDTNKTKLDFSYDTNTNILSLTKSFNMIDMVDDNTISDKVFTDEYNAFSILIKYFNSNGVKTFGNLEKYIVNSGKSDGLITMSTSGMNLYLSKIIPIESNDGITYEAVKLNSFEYNLNSTNKDGKVLTVESKDGIGGKVVIDKIATVNGKDIVTLKEDTKEGYELYDVSIADENGTKITDEVKYNKTSMTFEMPNKNVVINSSYLIVPTIELSLNELNIKVDETKNITAEAKHNGEILDNIIFKFETSNDEIEIKTSVGQKSVSITGKKVGTAKLKVISDSQSDSVKSVEKTITVNVTDGTELIEPTISVDDMEVSVDETKKININTNGVDGTLTLTSDNVSVATVETNNSIKGIKEGNTTVTVKFEPKETDKYKSVTKKFNLTVTKKTELIEPTVSVDDMEVSVDETKKVNINTNGVDGTLTLTSKNESIASIDGINVKGIKEGNTTVTVKFEPKETDKYKSVTKEFKVIVTKKTQTTKIGEFVSDFEDFIDDINSENKDNKYAVSYDENNKILSLSYCENGCSTSKPDSTIKLKYDEGTGVLKIGNSIKIFKDVTKNEMTYEYKAITPLIAYVIMNYDKNYEVLATSLAQVFKTGVNSFVYTIKDHGLILLYNDYKKIEDSEYLPQTLQNLEIDVDNGFKSDNSPYVVSVNTKNGTVLVDNVKNVNGKDIVTLKVKANDKYGFDSLTIKDKNKKDITKDVNYSSSTMTFEMPSSDVIIDATFITNAKTNVTDMTLLLVITLTVFGLGYFVLKKNIKSFGI